MAGIAKFARVSATILFVTVLAGGCQKPLEPKQDEIWLGWFNIETESIDDYNLKHNSFSVGSNLRTGVCPLRFLWKPLAR